MTYDELLDKWIRKLGRPCTAGEIVHDLRQLERPVRCKDCKHYLDSNEKCRLIDTRLHFYETNKVWTEYCYCAWGEREENAID